jgi:hypothetical protein
MKVRQKLSCQNRQHRSIHLSIDRFVSRNLSIHVKLRANWKSKQKLIFFLYVGDFSLNFLDILKLRKKSIPAALY